MRDLFVTAGVGAILFFCGWIYLKFIAVDYPKYSAKDLWEQQAYDDYMDIIWMITGAMSAAYLDKIKSKIENFENHYANLIPLKIVHQYVINMYGLVDEKASEITQPKPQLN